MKKILTVLFCITCIILVVLFVKYKNYIAKNAKIKEYNLEYEQFLDKQIPGTELTSIINKAVDNNEKNSVKKDEQGFYIKNDTNSIEIEVKTTDNDKTYKMESFYNNGMIEFLQYYNTIEFRCEKIEYNSLGKISYMLFEQKTN